MARSLICSSYASPLARALAKIVGLDVTPRTWKSLIRDSRLPVRSRSLLMSSSQTDTPAWVSSASTSAIMTAFLPSLEICFRACSAPRLCDGRPRGGGDSLGRDTELPVEHGLGGGRTEVVHADRLAGVADENLPRRSDDRFDRHARPNRRREDFLLIRSVLCLKP